MATSLLTFQANYTFQQLPELPASGDQVYYPQGSSEGGRDGLIVGVQNGSNKKWVAVFAFGDVRCMSWSWISTCPSPWHLCVVAAGCGYIIDVREPAKCEIIPVTPVKACVPVPESSMLVLANDTRLIAYDINGIAWRTDRLVTSGLKILDCIGTTVVCSGFDLRSESDIHFPINSVTGQRSESY